MKLHEKLIYLVWIVAMTIQAWAYRQLIKKAMEKFSLSIADSFKRHTGDKKW